MNEICLPVANAVFTRSITHSIANVGKNGTSMTIHNKKKITFGYRKLKENDKKRTTIYSKTTGIVTVIL